MRIMCDKRLVVPAICIVMSSALPAAAQSLFDTEPAYGQRLFSLEQPQRPRPPVEDVEEDWKWRISRPGLYTMDKTNIEVRTEPDTFSVFERGKRIYSTASLAQAKRFAERRADALATDAAKTRPEPQQQPFAKDTQ